MRSEAKFRHSDPEGLGQSEVVLRLGKARHGVWHNSASAWFGYVEFWHGELMFNSVWLDFGIVFLCGPQAMCVRVGQSGGWAEQSKTPLRGAPGMVKSSWLKAIHLSAWATLSTVKLRQRTFWRGGVLCSPGEVGSACEQHWRSASRHGRGRAECRECCLVPKPDGIGRIE